MGLTLVLRASRGPELVKDDTSHGDWASSGAESGPREAAGAAGTGRAMKDEGRGPEEEGWMNKEVGTEDVGRTGVVGEEAISESWLRSSEVLVFLAAGVGAELVEGEVERRCGAAEGGTGGVVRERMADWRC